MNLMDVRGKKFKQWALFFGHIFIVTLVPAKIFASGSLSSDTSIGSTIFITGLAYDGDTDDLKSKDKTPKSRYNWDLAYTFTQSQAANPVANQATVDNTSEFNGLLGWESLAHVELGGGLQYSTTPNEKLVSSGPNLYLGYTHHFDARPDGPGANFLQGKEKAADHPVAEDDEFHSTVGLKETVMNLTYTQKPFNCVQDACMQAQQALKNDNTIHQFSIASELDLNPWEWLAIKLSYTSYSYDRNVNSFLQTLTNARVVGALLGGLATTLGGFPLEQYEADFIFYFLDKWDFEAVGDIIPSVTDSGTATIYKGTLSREISSFKVGLGYERDTSSTAVDNIALVSLKYNLQ